MNIIICGAGRVGFTIAKQLSEQGHSITVIDPSGEDIKKIDDALKSSLKNCSNDPKLCNEQELCKMATYFPKVIGKKVKVWKDWGGSEEYLKEAELRGYHCGVFQETCPENVPNCKPINKPFPLTSLIILGNCSLILFSSK